MGTFILTIGVILLWALILAKWAAGAPVPQREVVAMIRRVFPDDQKRALCIAARESTGTPGLYDPGSDNGISYGLFAIHRRTWDWHYNPRAIPVVGKIDWRRIYEPAYNARSARKIYDHAGGWGPWSTRGMCGG